MNHSQVAYHTGQELKQSLSEGGERPDAEPHRHHLWKLDVVATNKQDDTQDFVQLHGDGVIGDGVTES